MKKYNPTTRIDIMWFDVDKVADGLVGSFKSDPASVMDVVEMIKLRDKTLGKKHKIVLIDYGRKDPKYLKINDLKKLVGQQIAWEKRVAVQMYENGN